MGLFSIFGKKDLEAEQKLLKKIEELEQTIARKDKEISDLINELDRVNQSIPNTNTNTNTNEVQGIIFTKNGYHFNGSKIDRSFSYSKIDKALNGNNQAEYQREYEPHHMQISHFENKESELINGALGLLDFTSSPDADSQEEADFRRLIQQKPKKKRTRGFKL